MDDEQLIQIIETYGVNPQIDVAIEEMSELIKALLKFRRGIENKTSDSDEQIVSVSHFILLMNVAEEIADVQIMLRQLELIFQNEEKVNEWIEYKINRQMRRLEKESEVEGIKTMEDVKFKNITDRELEKYLAEYGEHRSGEIGELTRAAAIRIGALSERVKILEKEEDDGK